MQRPPRPLGVSLAIVTSVFLFTLLPISQVILIVVVRQHFMNLSFPSGLQPTAVGGDFLGVPASSLFLQTVLALVFLIVAVAAWRGRRPAMRFVMVLTVIALTAIKLISLITQSAAPQSLENGISSGNGLFNALSAGQFVTELIVMLYVVWYMNRGPARAFYRGYYLPTPTESASESQRE